MKRFILPLAVLFIGVFVTRAGTFKKTAITPFNYGNSFIFVENGVTFSVYPDGEFDFYINNRLPVGVPVNAGYGNVTFNTGFNYNAFVQYDDYGAVIQVENVPVFYDFYGRVRRIGGINIWYRDGRVRRLGGLRVFYNPVGGFDYFTGYINVYNRFYVYRPFHRFFIRPAVGFCQVFPSPYRRYYHPVRYTYYSPYVHNYRRPYVRVGETYRHFDRSRTRSRIYRNDRRVAVHHDGRRSTTRDRNTATYTRRSVATNTNRVASRSASNRNANRIESNSRERYNSNRGNLNSASRERRTVASNSSTNRSVSNRSAPKADNREVRTYNRSPKNRSTVSSKPEKRRSVTKQSRFRSAKSGKESTRTKRTTVSRDRSNTQRSGTRRVR